MNFPIPSEWVKVTPEMFQKCLSEINYVRDGYANAVVYTNKGSLKRFAATDNQNRNFISPDYLSPQERKLQMTAPFIAEEEALKKFKSVKDAWIKECGEKFLPPHIVEASNSGESRRVSYAAEWLLTRGYKIERRDNALCFMHGDQCLAKLEFEFKPDS